MNPAPTTTTRVSGPVTDARSSELAAVRSTRTPGPSAPSTGGRTGVAPVASTAPS